MTILPDRPFLKSSFDKYDPEYVLEHFFDENGVKDSAPEELKAEYKEIEIKLDFSSNCL